MPLATYKSDKVKTGVGAKNTEAMKAATSSLNDFQKNAKEQEEKIAKERKEMEKNWGDVSGGIDQLTSVPGIAQAAKDRIYAIKNDKNLTPSERAAKIQTIYANTAKLSKFWKTNAANMELINQGGAYSRINEIDGTVDRAKMINGGTLTPVYGEDDQIMLVGVDANGDKIEMTMDEFMNNPSTQMIPKADLSGVKEDLGKAIKEAKLTTSDTPHRDAMYILNDFTGKLKGMMGNSDVFLSLASDYSNYDDVMLQELSQEIDRKNRGLDYNEDLIEKVQDDIAKNLALQLGDTKFREAISGRIDPDRKEGSTTTITGKKIPTSGSTDTVYEGDKDYDASALDEPFTSTFEYKKGNRYYDIAAASLGTSEDDRDQSFFIERDVEPPVYDVDDDGSGTVTIGDEVIEVSNWKEVKTAVGEYAATLDEGNFSGNVENFTKGNASQAQIESVLSGSNYGVMVDKLDTVFEGSNVDFSVSGKNLTIKIGTKNVVVDMEKVGDDPKTRYDYIIAFIDQLKS